MQGFTRSYEGILPTISSNVFIAETAAIIGDVQIGNNSSVWFGCTVRGDVNKIRIGKFTNIQDGTCIHVTRKLHSTIIGNYVTVGHMALLHGCELREYSFVGMGATVMDGAIVESYAMVAAGALVTPGKTVPTGQLWAGSPARYMRDLTAQEMEHMEVLANSYAALAGQFISECDVT